MLVHLCNKNVLERPSLALDSTMSQLLLFFLNCSEKKMHVGNSSILFYFTASRDKIKALVEQTVASCSKGQEQV